MNSILLAPHNDDETLFAAYTLMRQKPLVVIVTDGFIQGQRGDPITAQQRREETLKAMDILGCSVIFLGIPDTHLTEHNLPLMLRGLVRSQTVFAPSVQGGNAQHDLVGKVADELYGDQVVHYTTYTKTELWTTGRTEIFPTQEEIDLKNRALDCYTSQINLPATAPHFEAVRGRSEWYA